MNQQEDPVQGASPETPDPASQKDKDAVSDATAKPNRRSPQFRAALLAKLPALGFESTTAAASLDVREDLAGIGQLDADAFLAPIEKLTRSGRE